MLERGAEVCRGELAVREFAGQHPILIVAATKKKSEAWGTPCVTL